MSKFLFKKYGKRSTDFPKVKQLAYSRTERVLRELILASSFTDEEVEDEKERSQLVREKELTVHKDSESSALLKRSIAHV